MTTHSAYNALATAHVGNYRLLARLLREHLSWEQAFASSLPGQERWAEEIFSDCQSQGIKLILATDPDYPLLLHEMPFAPHGMYMLGCLPVAQPCVAIVGTRRAGSEGKATAARFASAYARAGVPVVSGLAFGIDYAAHEAALAARGTTIAVLASGLDSITPRSNTRLGRSIYESGGALVSEYPINTPTQPHFFLERNRIVSGLSKGVVVIEAPARSGTLATARFAIDQNREVFVVPGSITNDHYAGSHTLIRGGATLVTAPEDTFETLGITASEAGAATHAQLAPFLDLEEQRIVELLHTESYLTADAISIRLQMTSPAVSRALGSLLLAAIIIEDGPNYRIAPIA